MPSLGSGFFPFLNTPGLTTSRRVTGSGVQSYMIVQPDTIAGEADTCTPCASGGGVSWGVITTPQGDPNNNGIIPSGTVVEVTYTGTVPVLLGSGAYTKGVTQIIASTVYGLGKALGTESGNPMMVIGTYADYTDTLSSGAGPKSVQLNLSTFVR
jgi:hypothetical protein